MSVLTDRISTVMRQHSPNKCWWLCDGGTHWTDAQHAAHVAEMVVAQLFTEEKHTYADYEAIAVSGGRGVMRYSGQTSTYKGMKTVRRWVSGWTAVEDRP